MTLKDLRQAVVSLRRSPGFTLTALVVLALGIGASTAIFSVVYGVLISPLPFNDPDRLVRIWSNHEERGLPFFSVTMPDFLDWRARARNLESIATFERQRSVRLRGEAEQLSMTRVSGDLFSLLGVPPVLGRPLTHDDTVEGSGDVAVISHGLWQRRFGGRSDVLGKTIAVGDQSWTVVGVMPARFEIPNAPSDAWLPLPLTVATTARAASPHLLRVLGRARNSLQPEEVRRELADIAAQLGEEYPESNGGWGVAVRPLVDTVVSPEFRRSVLLLAGAVAFVLLMASANVSGLLLGRATARRREMAIRAALGANRAALVRMLLLESLVLASAAGGVGLLLAIWGIDALKTLGFESVPRLDEVTMSLPVLGFAALVTLLTAGLFGVGPALLTSKNTSDALRARESSTDARASRGRSVLIVTEVALAVVLLVGAGLMMRSFVRLQQRPLGFDPTSLLVAQFAAPSDLGERPDFTGSTENLISRLSTLPGVTMVAGGSSLPIAGPNNGNTFEIEGEPTIGEQLPDTDYRVVTPGYFRALGIPLVTGRLFTESDGPQAPAVTINRSAAQRYWPTRDPIGTRVRLGRSPWMTVVGVVGDTRYYDFADPGDAVRPMMYLPHRQRPDVPLMLALKTSTPPEGLADVVRTTVRTTAPEFGITRLDTMTAILAQARGPQRFATALLAVFAWVAVILAAAGLYGLLAYLVGSRTKEIGVRLALGATPIEVVRLTAGRGAALAVLGITLGMIASLGLTGLLRSVLFDVRTTDPLTYVLAAFGFLLVTVAASYLPARRALRIDPVEALRAE